MLSFVLMIGAIMFWTTAFFWVVITIWALFYWDDKPPKFKYEPAANYYFKNEQMKEKQEEIEMETKIKYVNAYLSSDDRHHKTYEECRKHELYLALKEIKDPNDKWGKGYTPYRDSHFQAIASLVAEFEDEVREILNEFHKLKKENRK